MCEKERELNMRIAELELHLAAETQNYSDALAGRIEAERRVEQLDCERAALARSVENLVRILPCGHPGAVEMREDDVVRCAWCASLAEKR